MATRPSWSGHIRISLVSFPIQLFAGSVSARRIPFHQIHEPTGERVRNQSVLDNGKKVEKADIVKGYEYEKNKYVTLTPDEVKEVRLPTKDAVTICEFVDIAEIDAMYYDAPYYAVPKAEKGDTGLEAFTVFREALKKSGKAALGEVVLAGKEHLVAIRPCGKGLLVETLRYETEVRSSDTFFDEIKAVKPEPEQLALMTSLIKQKSHKLEIGKYEDSYESALKKLVDRKMKNLPLHDPEEDEDTDSSNVISLMDALKRSVEGKGKTAKPKAVEKKAPVRKSAKAVTKAKPAPKKTSAKKKAA